ncbi:MAG: hypothetical protein QG639_307 [Patescibacteria group bacterium]|nr:hypothetical protein [Patescibacteria group bacterium]
MKHLLRYWEIDVVRAFALLFMLVQHTWLVWNFISIGDADAPLIAERIGKVGAVLFLVLVGVSGYILYSKIVKNCSDGEIDRLFFKRGLFLLGMGLVISLVTFIAIPQAPIYFGVLSFIGLSVILLPFFIRNNWLKWILIFAAPVVGYLLSLIHPKSYLLLPFGIYPVPFQSKDYWPFFPWISVVLAGVVIGEHVYTMGDRQFSIPAVTSKAVLTLQWIGSHTLLLYMLHLPVLYILLQTVKYLLEL